MGLELNSPAWATSARRVNPRLDAATDALIIAMIATIAPARPDLLAVILYGSVARREERPLDDEEPSDVDLLLVFDTEDENIIAHQGHAIVSIPGDARNRHLDAPREVSVLLASRHLREWDPTFAANVARDGVALFQRGPLPPGLAAIDDRVPEPRSQTNAGESILALQGHGIELWDCMDAQAYVDNERDSWER